MPCVCNEWWWCGWWWWWCISALLFVVATLSPPIMRLPVKLNCNGTRDNERDVNVVISVLNFFFQIFSPKKSFFSIFGSQIVVFCLLFTRQIQICRRWIRVHLAHSVTCECPFNFTHREEKTFTIIRALINSSPIRSTITHCSTNRQKNVFFFFGFFFIRKLERMSMTRRFLKMKKYKKIANFVLNSKFLFVSN